MKETIDKVIKMNDKAGKIIEDAKQEAINIVNGAQKRAEIIIKESIDNAEKKAADISDSRKKEVDGEIEFLNAKQHELETAFENKFVTNEEKWIEEIVSEIISGAENV